MPIKNYSTTAASNNSAPPNGAPEQMLPSTVNNVIRQNMADIRSWYEDAEWRDFGDTATYVSGTSFTVVGDLTARYVANRRIRAVGSSTGTVYGTVASSSYSAPDTTVTVTWDSGSLISETLAISLGVTPTNKAIPSQAIEGLGTLAAEDTAPVANGGTGATTASGARTNLGIKETTILDTPELVVDTSAPTTGSWVTVNSATLAGASAALVKAKLGVISDGSPTAVSTALYARKTGSGLANNAATEFSKVNDEQAAGTTGYTYNSLTFWVPLDANGDFDYYVLTSSGGVYLALHILGYIA